MKEENNNQIKAEYLSKKKRTALSETINSFRAQIWNKETITKKTYQGLKEYFGFSGVSIYLLDPTNYETDYIYPEKEHWPFPEKEKKWLIKRTKDLLIQSESEPVDHYYIQNRELSIFVDQEQLKKDQANYDFSCSDGLYWILLSEDEIILGFIFIHNWDTKKLLYKDPNSLQIIHDVRFFIKEVAAALDNFMMHKKIETLLTDKQKLKERLQKDEEDLRRRLLEQSVLYDTSNALGNTMNYYQMLSVIMSGLQRVLTIDSCAIMLFNLTSSGDTELLIRIYNPINELIIKAVQSNIIAASSSLTGTDFSQEKVNVTIEKQSEYIEENETLPKFIKSFANVPLIFKDEIIGILNVCSTSENVFTRNEMTFLHTMANQLSSHLGRLQLIKDIEKTKIGSMIGSMTEGVLMLDEHNHLDVINSSARELLGFPVDRHISGEELISRLADLDLLDLYYDVLVKGESILNHEIISHDKIISVNVTPVIDSEKKRVGMVMVLRDVTELQKINRINQQRLDIISKVNLIINSITDLDNLLAFLIEFILNVANAEMGSIQLKEGKLFKTKVHSNFPDKIRREYKFVSGETISEYVTNSEEAIHIDNYTSNPQVNNPTKIALESYVCIPITVKKEVIGVVNIVRKVENTHPPLTLDDIETLSTITSLSGTAIYNAVLYKQTLEKQKLDQELRVAHEIQKKLLPGKLPKLENVNFGAISLPAREIGGDYYDIFELEDGNIGIVVADIVGKGIPAALHMVMVKSILHSNVHAIKSPLEAMNLLNTILEKDTVISKYVPMFYAILDPEKMTFRFCNAGHEPAILFSQKEFITLDTNGFPLGAWAEPEYEEKEIKLKKGDVITIFTDGIIEARNEQEEDFGFTRLKETISSNTTADAEKLADTLFQNVIEHTGNKEQHDDLTIVCIKASKKDEETPLAIKELRVSSAKKNVSVLRKEIEKIAIPMGFDESAIFNIKLAVNEAQANVLEHAYHGNEKGEILFKFFVYEDRLTISIKDYGPGMDQKSVKNENHLDELEGSGLGVFLINTLMDKVEYNRKTKIGTEMLLTKYIKKKEL